MLLNDRTELDDLKSRVDLAELIRGSGVELKPAGKNLLGRCPFHDDSTASLSVNEHEQLFNCFGCEAGGDALKFIQLKEKVEFPKAVERLKELALQAPLPPKPNGKKSPGPQDPLPGNLSRADLLGRVAERYCLRFRECQEGQQYLTSRGLGSKELWEAFRVGYVDGSLLESLPKNGPSRDALVQLGVLNSKGREHFLGCVVVPLEHPDEGLLGFYGRKIDPEASCPHLYLPGPKRGVLHWQALKQAKRVFIAESVLDAFSLWMAGIRDVTCLYGAGALPIDLQNLLGRFSTPEVVFCLDGDNAGQDATQRFSDLLSKRGVYCLSVPLPAGKDPNQLLQELGPEQTRERLSLPKAILAPSAEKSTDPEEPMESAENGFTLRQGEIRYKMTMVGPFNGRLRGTLVASRSTQIYSERLDLHSHRARSLNALQLVRHFDLARVEAERHLSGLLRAALKWVDGHKVVSEGKPILLKAPVLTEQEKLEALVLLRRPDLVNIILEDTQTLGFVGEEKSRLLGYLISLSRKLPRPLSGIVRSQSGAGKSTLTDMVEQMTPPEDVLFYSRLSPQVLYYMPHNLTGKILILEERAGGEGADYSIRTLQSRSKLKLAVTVKNPVTGKMDACSYEVEGPVAFMETTTDAELNPENATRCFELHMDESEQQTERIQQRQRLNRLPVDYDIDHLAESIRKKHHNAQRMLKPLRVFIPYADRIKFPTRWLRTRRDNERFLCLIEAITFLHQHQREQGQAEGKPYVLATLADYRLAYDLAQDVLSNTFHELSRDAQVLWETLIPYVLTKAPQTPKNFIFTLKELREITAQNNHHLRTRMAELVDMEYVFQVGNQNGKPLSWRVLTTEIKAQRGLPGLTTPDELERLL